MLEFLSCAKPVILGVDGQARQLLEEAGGGVAIEPENAEALVAAVVRFADDPAQRAETGRNGRAYILKKCSRQSTAEAYIQVLERILSSEAQQNSAH